LDKYTGINKKYNKGSNYENDYNHKVVRIIYSKKNSKSFYIEKGKGRYSSYIKDKSYI
jgi:hypothetical protein